MERISHIISTHIFIFATSLAMLVHSTWTFGTLFSGQQPVIDGSIQQWIAYALWVTPALLVALAIDIGQIQTSVKLSHATAQRQKVTLGITFITLALAGYYLQWFHLAHHIPQLEFGSGLSLDMRSTLQGVKDIAIFIVPALLPLSTILYTLSSDTQRNEKSIAHEHIETVETVTVTPPLIESHIDHEPLIQEDDTQPGEPVSVASVPATIRNRAISKSVDIPSTATDYSNGDNRRCAHDGCNKPLPKNARSNQLYCTVNCRTNAYKARQQAIN